MKINSINIVSFGKIKNLKIDFADNLNIIYGDNEAGKTHIAEFIKLMFYGSGTRGQGLNNTRKKYKPWDDSKMGGSIDFTHEGKRYRLEREFKASQATDTVVLIDLDSGVPQNLSGSDNIGAKFFGISLSAFEQSVFIDNSVVFSGKGDNGELNIKLANLMTSADEDVSFNKIIKNITDAKEVLISKNTKKGLIPELNSRLEELERLTNESADIYQSALEKGKELDALRLALDAKKAEKNSAFEKLKQFSNFSLKKQLTAFKVAADEYESAEKQLTLSDGSVINEEIFKGLEDGLNALKNRIDLNEKKLKELENDTDAIANLLSNMPSTDGLISALKEKKDNLKADLNAAEKTSAENMARLEILKTKKAETKGNVNLPLLIIGFALILLGVAAGFFYIHLLPFAAIGVILAILGFTLKTKPDLSAIEGEITALQSSEANCANEKIRLTDALAEIDKQINDCIIKVGTNSTLLEEKKQEAMKKQAEMITENGELEREKATVFGNISRFRTVYDVPSAEKALEDIEALLDQMSIAKVKAESAIAHTGCRTTAEALAKLESLPDSPEITESRAELEDALKNLQDECATLDKSISTLEAEIKAITSGVRTPAEYEREASEITEKLSSMKAFTSAADIALETLNEADTLQRRSWGSALETKALKIFTGLTNGAYSGISVSKEFDITVRSEGDITSHSVEYLSRGTVHQAYFALRLALSEFLCNDNGPLPIILDDIFSQYDATRTAAGIDFLKEYAEENQVIFFTCHKELLETESTNLINL